MFMVMSIITRVRIPRIFRRTVPLTGSPTVMAPTP